MIKKIFFNLFMPVVLLLFCPIYVMILVYTAVELQGSFLQLFSSIASDGFVELLRLAWLPYIFGSQLAWRMIAIYAIVQLVFMKVLPGKPRTGPITESGHVPEYKANGVSAYLMTISLFLLASYGFGWFSPSILFDHYLEIIGALNLSSIVFCIFLFFKGLYFPSTVDSGRRGNIFHDYYWGTELYPRIFGWDVKVFTNCRFGMMSWSLVVISAAAKQFELYGYLSTGMLVSMILQLTYVFKFFIWEIGYLSTIDIMHDRAGFYLCWGCLVWLPSLYMTPSLYMASNPVNLSIPLTGAILLLGFVAIFTNYYSDLQRQNFRRKNGNIKVFNKEPRVVEAFYTTSDGKEHKTLLLASGFWGLSRHFNYFAELVAAFLWCVPAAFTSVYPYQYFIFLFILLMHRLFRDDLRCKKKYGKAWDEYCRLVPNRVLPSFKSIKS